jgi:hypothetical protein
VLALANQGYVFLPCVVVAAQSCTSTAVCKSQTEMDSRCDDVCVVKEITWVRTCLTSTGVQRRMIASGSMCVLTVKLCWRSPPRGIVQVFLHALPERACVLSILGASGHLLRYVCVCTCIFRLHTINAP